MAQAIFLPGAWGKIPDFMGKNHPTPGAAMAFCMFKTTPPKTGLFQTWENFCSKGIVFTLLMSIIIDRTNEKPAVLFITKRGVIKQ